MTTRSCITENFQRIAGFLDRCASIAIYIQTNSSE